MAVFCSCTVNFHTAPLYHQKERQTFLNKNYTSICSWDYKLLSGGRPDFIENGTTG
jgi:hypothetical protein